MSLRVFLPAALAIGMVWCVGTQANGFELLDGLLGASGYGSGAKGACCDGKATQADTCTSRRCAQKGFLGKGCSQQGAAQTGCAQKGAFQKACSQKGFVREACAQKGSAQKGSAQKGCCTRPVRCCEPICIPRLCLLQEAACRIRVAAVDIHCKTQAVCDAIKVRLFWPSCYYQKSCGCAPSCGAEPSCGIPVQSDLEMPK